MIKIPIISGIYKITNKLNGSFYIGSARDIYRRWKQHKYGFKNNDHSNKKLLNDWKKYGSDIFIFSIVEECCAEKLLEREQYYLDNAKPNYNIVKTAGGGRANTGNGFTSVWNMRMSKGEHDEIKRLAKILNTSVSEAMRQAVNKMFDEMMDKSEHIRQLFDKMLEEKKHDAN